MQNEQQSIHWACACCSLTVPLLAYHSPSCLQNYTSVLEIILRLRQICDDARLCPEHVIAAALGAVAAAAPPSPELLQKLLTALQGDEECSICLTEMELPVATLCGHVFCRRCIETSLLRKPACPLCRAPVAAANLVEPPKPEPAAAAAAEAATQGDAGAAEGGSSSSGGAGTSAKVAQLMAHLAAASAKSAALPPGSPPIKSLVFSQFTGMLNAVQAALKAAGIPHARLDGSTPAKTRAELLEAFQCSDTTARPDMPVVFLISLKAGGVGMNLTAASEVHLMDPWWNAAVEEQAMVSAPLQPASQCGSLLAHYAHLIQGSCN